MVCKYYLWLSNFKAKSVNFWQAICHNFIVVDVISSHVHW